MWAVNELLILVFLLVIQKSLSIVFKKNVSRSSEGEGQLIFVHIIFRHGDRTPVEPYPNDPWKDRQYWPEGFGQLTNIGKGQQYRLGEFLRNRYAQLMSENGSYSPDDLYVQSTDVDRTLMSAESSLAGLFPPNNTEIWNPDLMWQPIPIHTIPDRMDYILAAKRPCPSYDYALKKYKESTEFQNLNRKYKPLYEYLEKNAGKRIRSLTEVQNLYNTLWIEDLKNFTLPDWTKKVYPGGDMQWISARSFQTNTYTPQLARLKTGFLIRDILGRFSQKSQSILKPNRSLWINSAHDTTIANVLNSLGLFELHSPPYSACIMLELYQLNTDFYIQLFYRNTTSKQLSPLNIPQCGPKCPLEKFYAIYDAIIPKMDFESECRLPLLSMTYEEADFSGFEMSLIAIFCCAIIVLLMAITSWRYYNRDVIHDQRWYLRL